MVELLNLDHVTKRYGQVVAVDDISLEIRRGEFFSLLGPSGCGKTTLLRMIGGFILPDRGRVLVDGVDVHADPIVAKRRIGFLSGDTQLYQRLSPRAAAPSSTNSTCGPTPIARAARCRRARNNGPTSPAPSCTIRRC